ncbi:MAG: response regulator transcription factor [Bacteroidales bacterium]|nr:response regulator transcription factor [Bacteroidales bacterium]
MPRILIVDDEQDIREILSFNLEAEGYDVLCAASGEEAVEVLSGTKVDLIMLDVMMERMSGFDVARQLRAGGDATPVIFLTALADEASQLEGFGAGADDYVAKPFSFSTVLARVKAVLRRSGNAAAPHPTTDTGQMPVHIDAESGVATVYGQPIDLTRKELQILQLLMDNAGTYFGRDEIMSRVWGDEVCVSDRSVDVHIARLRKKLGAAAPMLQGKTNFGYRIENPKTLNTPISQNSQP